MDRIPHPTDRRTTLARITPAGRRRVVQAADALAEIGFGLDGMSPADLARAEGALVDLRREAGDF